MLDNQITSETDFFNDFADLFEKYPDLKGKYNLSLNHSHFDVESDEILMEQNDPSSRTLTTKVIKRGHRKPDAIEVEWHVEKVRGVLTVTALQDCCVDPS